jgi:hypothetical protein
MTILGVPEQGGKICYLFFETLQKKIISKMFFLKTKLLRLSHLSDNY